MQFTHLTIEIIGIKIGMCILALRILGLRARLESHIHIIRIMSLRLKIV